MAELDPWGPIMAVLFDNSHSSDYVVNVLGLAGLLEGKEIGLFLFYGRDRHSGF